MAKKHSDRTRRKDAQAASIVSSARLTPTALSIFTGVLLLASGALWLASSWTNIDPSAVVTRPISSSSSMSIEWIGASLLMILAGVDVIRRRFSDGAAIAVPTISLGMLQILLSWFPLHPYVRTTGSILIVIAMLLGLVGCAVSTLAARSSWHLTSYGLWSTLLLVTPAVAWGITYLPAWYTYHYSVTSGYFTATGTHFLTVDGGSSFSSGLETSVLSLIHASTPILLIVGACWWWRNTTRTLALLSVGLNILFISADGFFGLGALNRSYDPSWWGWSHHGAISVTPTLWLWLSLGTAIVFLVRAVMLALLTFSSRIPREFESSQLPVLASIEHDLEIHSPEEQF